MKNKIAFKLIKYFAISLLLFSIVIGGFFMLFFRAYTVEMYKTDMGKKATSISANLTNYMSNSSTTSKGMNGTKSGRGQYFQGFLNQIDMSDVWIVDESLNLITIGFAESNSHPYTDLPESADLLVKQAFLGSTTFSEDFSTLLDSPALTIGTPVYLNNEIIAVLLLHSPIEGLNDAIYKGFSILVISMLLALLVSISISIWLALSFTKPLEKMKRTAIKLASGDYSAKTDVKLDDEIGDLAATLDILSERLNLASKESEGLEEMRRAFIANISHELRTPVTVIRGSLEALCDKVVTSPDQVEKYHNQMLSESIFLQRLVNDLLDLSKLQSPDFKIQIKELNLIDIINDTIRVSNQMGIKKSIVVDFKYDKTIFPILGDYDRLRQMLLIMIDNSIKFSPENSIISIIIEGNTLSIIDKGPGIPFKDLPYIFDRFYKSKDESNSSGTGLGLSIAKQIADRHNINIEIESPPEGGTRVVFTFSV